MKISKKEDFALIFMNILSLSDERKYVPISEISARTGMPLLFLKHIASSLLKKGLIISKEGIGGGYMLSRSPQKIMISEILSSISGDTVVLPCSGKECGVEKSRCVCSGFWRKLDMKISGYLSKISLYEFSK